MGVWQEVLLGKALVNGIKRLVIADRCRCGEDMGNEARPIRITGFGEVDFVAHPITTSLGAVACLDIVRRVDALATGRQITRIAPADRVAWGIKLLPPYASQGHDGRMVAQTTRDLIGIEEGEEPHAVSADLFSEALPIRRRLGKAIAIKAWAVAVKPLQWDVAAEPRRSHGREGIQGGTHGFTNALNAGEATNSGQDMSRIGALMSSPTTIVL